MDRPAARLTVALAATSLLITYLVRDDAMQRMHQAFVLLRGSLSIVSIAVALVLWLARRLVVLASAVIALGAAVSHLGSTGAAAVTVAVLAAAALANAAIGTEHANEAEPCTEEQRSGHHRAHGNSADELLVYRVEPPRRSGVRSHTTATRSRGNSAERQLVLELSNEMFGERPGTDQVTSRRNATDLAASPRSCGLR